MEPVDDRIPAITSESWSRALALVTGILQTDDDSGEIPTDYANAMIDLLEEATRTEVEQVCYTLATVAAAWTMNLAELQDVTVDEMLDRLRRYMAERPE